MVPNFPFFTKAASTRVGKDAWRRGQYCAFFDSGKDAFHRVPNSTSVFSAASCSTAWFRLKSAVETISDAVERVLTMPRLAVIPLRHSPLDRAPSPWGEGCCEGDRDRR